MFPCHHSTTIWYRTLTSCVQHNKNVDKRSTTMGHDIIRDFYIRKINEAGANLDFQKYREAGSKFQLTVESTVAD